MRNVLAIALVFSLSFGTPSSAAAAELEGYVVKAEGKKVYLDLGEGTGIRRKLSFDIYKEGEELKHPVTGKSLGTVREKVATGNIHEVHEKYSLGQLRSGEDAVAPGQRVQVHLTETPPQQTQPQQASSESGRQPSMKSPLLDIQASDVAVGDVDGDGRPEAVVSGKSKVKAYPLDGDDWKPACSFEDDRTGSNFLSVEADDLDGDGKAEVFATVNNTFFKRVESFVLVCEGGKFKEKTTLPWMVRSYKKPDGGHALAIQQLSQDSSFPLSSIYSLEYKDGKYVRSKDSIKHKRLDWLYGFSFSKGGEDPILLYYNRVGRLRIQFRKGAWSTKKKFGQTAERIKQHDRTFQFYPRLIVEDGPEGISGVHTLKNIPRFFALASSFGLFSGSELHHLRYNGMALEPDWKSQISGYAAGLAELGSDRLVVAVQSPDDRTSLWLYDK